MIEMASEEKETDNGGSVGCRWPLKGENAEEMHANGFAPAAGNSAFVDRKSVGTSGEGLKTYSRRKRAKVLLEDQKVAWPSSSQVPDKQIKEKGDQASDKHCRQNCSVEPHISVNATDDCSLKTRRNVVPEKMSPALLSEDGLQGCVQDALASHPEGLTTAIVEESIRQPENLSKCTSQTGPTLHGLQNAVNANLLEASNGSTPESNCPTVTALCRHVFLDVVSSEKFSELSDLLLKSFPGMKGEKVFDFSSINSRMKEGLYESSPNHFHADMQQVWTKMQRIGMELVALAKSLSDKSRASYHEQVGSLSQTFEAGKNDFVADKSHMHDRAERAEACAVHMVSACWGCGEKADGRCCLVCDSCEGVYHVSCIEPAVEEIPIRSWYCADCTAKGIGSPHDNCVVCERLNNLKSPISGGIVGEPTEEETVMELQESSNGLVEDELQMLNDGDTPVCNVCRSQIENGEKLKICRHTFCPHKFYHARCLTRKQLKTYGSRWYCPSCLCRSCLTDRDDDKIVLCDSCDHAYHIYCMRPARSSIPRGKWFCKKCNADIRRVREAKMSFEDMQQKLKNRGVERKGSHGNPKDKQRGKDSQAVDKTGGMEMLLSALAFQTT